MFLSHRYQILEPLGRGSFGQTYIAEDTHLPGHPRCVVKQLKPISIEPHVLQEARRRFDAEATMLHELCSHEQIPRLLDRFECNGEFYLVLELIDGHPLSRELVGGQQLSESYALSLLENILTPLAFVHQHNVIHRDIKPSHLIRRERDGKIFIIDFGAVKQIVDPLETTKLTIVVGTPEYMSIEQWQGRPKLSSDIYAVGTICIQALTGLDSKQLARLFEEENGTVWWQGIQVSSALRDVLNKMVRSNYQERYSSAVEALEAVRQLSRVPPPPLPPSTLTSPVPSRSPRRSINWRWGMGIGVALLFGLGSFFWVGSRLNSGSSGANSSDFLETSWEGEVSAYEIFPNGQTVELTVRGEDNRQYQFAIPRKILDRIPNGSPLPGLKNKTVRITGLKPDRKLGSSSFAVDRAEQIEVVD
ncbi:MAG: serine/threonine protein kinase [Cyanobacteria bacterium J055]|nr:MAG: serine/threonine protein kinase [Cyanobacteria bacterium J055]